MNHPKNEQALVQLVSPAYFSAETIQENSVTNRTISCYLFCFFFITNEKGSRFIFFFVFLGFQRLFRNSRTKV